MNKKRYGEIDRVNENMENILRKQIKTKKGCKYLPNPSIATRIQHKVNSQVKLKRFKLSFPSLAISKLKIPICLTIQP